MTATVTIADSFLASPRGEYPNYEAGVMQVNDEVALRTQLAGIEGKLWNHGNVVIDDDHASSEERPGWKALGRMTSARLVDAGIIVNAHWFPAGIEVLRLSGQRFVSPSYDQTESLGGNRVRPIRLHSIGIVRAGNMKTIPPILNREGQCLVNRGLGQGFDALREPLTLESICQAHRDMAEAHAKKTNRNFTDAWDHISNRFTVLRVLMSVPPEESRLLLNRVRDGRPAIGPARTHDNAATQERFWSAVEKTADSVRDRFHSKTSWDGAPGSDQKWMGAGGYYTARRELQQKYGQGAEPDFIWERMQVEFPKEWADYILHHAHHEGIV